MILLKRISAIICTMSMILAGLVVPVSAESELIFYAEDMDITNIGSAGAISTVDVGISQNTDKYSEKFGISSDGEAISYNHINALDNSGDQKWCGYVEKNIEQDFEPGDYMIYILCDANRASGVSRQYEVKINDVSVGLTETAGNSVQYSTSTSSTLYIMKMKFSLGESVSNLNVKLQAPSGEAAPNFIAMLIEEPQLTVWNTFEKEFTGEEEDYGIVWYKYSGDSAGGEYSIDEDNTLSISSVDGAADADVCYGVSAVIKNIKPNSKYTISFKEKTELVSYTSNGFYLNTDTLTMTLDNKDPNKIEVAEIRNNKNPLANLHNEIVSDSDWHERSFEWTSGSGLPDGMDTYAAKFTFILRNSTGTAQIKDLTISGESAYTESGIYSITTADTEGGSIIAPASAEEGTEVKVQTVTEADKTASSLYYTEMGSDERVEIKDNTFIMPAANIEIGADFDYLNDDDGDGLIRLNSSAFKAEANSERGGGHEAGYAVDNDASTLWHSDWDENKRQNFSPDGAVGDEKPPYYITIDIGKVLPVSSVSYIPRTGNKGNYGSMHGIIDKYEIETSVDGTEWETAAKGTWAYDMQNPDTDERYASFDTVEARYIRIIVRGGVNEDGGYYASAAEIYIHKSADNTLPVTEAKAALADVVSAAGNEDSAIARYVYEKGNELLADTSSAENINEIISIYNGYKNTEAWILQDLNPYYFERLNSMVSDDGFSVLAVSKYVSEIEKFNATGNEIDEKIVRDMGPELVMSDEDKKKPLYERIASAVLAAKEQIDKYPDEDYVMLRELISYMTSGSDSKYCDNVNIYGADADMCEYVVANINFALKNLDGRAKLDEVQQYRSGSVWLDKYGSKISAHGGQVIEADGKYYWYGEDNKVSYQLKTGVSCYSTEDFREWTYEGLAFNVFTQSVPENEKFTDEFLTDKIKGTQGRIERPKVVYNAKNDNYVMWMHLEKDGVYTFSCAGVAVSDSPTGPFKWKWYGKPVYDPYVTYNGKIDQAYRDMTLFVDDDGEAYAVYSSESNKVPYIVRLNDDYTWIDTEGMNTVTEEDFAEGRAAYNEDGVYVTGTLRNFNEDGTGYVDENGEPYTLTDDDYKTLIYFDTRTSGINGNFETPGDYNYYLPSFTRYQLRNGAYIVKNGRQDADGNKITDRDDCLDRIPLTDSEYSRWAKIGQYEKTSNNREAPAIIKHDGVYYMIASGISGWKANQGIYLRTDDLFGEWETVTNPFSGDGQTDYSTSYSYNNGMWTDDYKPDRSKSFLSQSTCMFEVNGSVYYMGDRWMDGDYSNVASHYGVKKSTYVWLPVTFTENQETGKTDMSIYWCDTLEFDVESKKELPVLGKYVDTLKVNFESDKEKVWLSIEPENGAQLPQLTLCVGVYGSGGELISVELIKCETDETGITVVSANKPQLKAGETLKFMLWDSDQIPVIESIAE